MYDLLLKGAHVVDPLNGVNGVNDVAAVSYTHLRAHETAR